jgi:acetolactate synthase-1/2/3 large subunit
MLLVTGVEATMPYLSGAEVLVASLAKEGVEVVFGIPGVQIMDALDAIYRDKNIRWISTRHEQTAAYMAYGYARTTDKIGVAMVLPGPGALNTTAAIGTAYTASTPVLLISGQIESYHLGFHRGVLHELDDQTEIFRYLTKWSGRALKVEDIPVLLQEALTQLTTGRPRPVEIEVPFDLWSEKAEMNPVIARPGVPQPAAPGEIKQAAGLLKSAARPLILAGGGAAKANISAEITRIAERLNAPVVMTTEGQGSIHCQHPLCAGNFTLWLNPIFKKADVLLVLGSRLRASGNTRLELRPDQKVIQIDHDPAELGRNHRIDLGIKADARDALNSLTQEITTPSASRWRPEEIAAIRNDIGNRLEKTAPVQMSIIRSIRSVLGDDDIIVPDITNIGYWCDIAYPVNKAGTYVESSYFATLGFAFPTALGAKIGNPDRNVVVICGDGGFPYAAMELATAVQEEINVVTLLFSDNAYGTVTGIQRRQFGGRFIGNQLLNPDYVKLAESFGAVGVRLSDHKELGDALKAALPANRPTLIEIPVPLLDPPWDVL